MKWQLLRNMWRSRTYLKIPSWLKEFEVQGTEFYLGWQWTSLYLLLQENEKSWLKKTEKNIFCLCVLLRLELREEKKVLLTQSLRKTVQYCTKCISHAPVVMSHYYDRHYYNQFLKTVFLLDILTKCYFSTAIPVK